MSEISSSQIERQTAPKEDLTFLSRGFKKLFYISICLSLLSIISLLGSVFYLNKQAKQLESNLKSVNKTVTDQKETITWLDESNIYQTIEHYIEGDIVTDDLVVEKISFYRYEKPMIYLDVLAQPDLAFKYKGQGKFDLSDREVKGMIKEITAEVEKTYNGLKSNSPQELIDFKKYEIIVTIKNYEIGKYINGSYKLKGDY